MSAALPEPPDADDHEPEPFRPDRPFLRRQGLKAGLTKHQVDGPGYTRLFGSARVSARIELTTRYRARAALLVVPHGVVSHHTAALLWGGIVPETTQTHLVVEHDRDRRRREGLVCHVRPSGGTATAEGVTVTTPAQTFTDLSTHLSLVDLVVLGDSLVKRGVVTIDELRDAAGGVEGRGAARARAAADLVRAGAESPMESRVRLMLVLSGLPEPELQHQVGDQHTRYRLDLAWPALRLAVEYDGRQHAESTQQWGRDLRRREWLDANGWRLIVLRSEDVYDAPWPAVCRIVDAMSSRGFERTTTRPTQAFIDAFPGRPWRSRRSI